MRRSPIKYKIYFKMKEVNHLSHMNCFSINIISFTCYPNTRSNTYYIVGSDAMCRSKFYKFKYYGFPGIDLCTIGTLSVKTKDEIPVLDRYKGESVYLYNIESIQLPKMPKVSNYMDTDEMGAWNRTIEDNQRNNSPLYDVH